MSVLSSVVNLLTPTIERERNQVDRLKKFKASRDAAVVTARLDDLRSAARGSDHLRDPMKAALKAHATLGEVSDARRDVFGVYRPG
ncbi:MAG: methylmalonyl-CoA mutase family protein [Actinomycetota bacterium]